MLYSLLKASKPVENTRYVKTYTLTQDDKNYKIIIAKRRANRRTIIHCIDNHIDWEQYPLLPRIWSGRLEDNKTICKVEKPKNETVYFIIKGKPNGVTGLDDGLFRGVKKFDENYVNVMAFSHFKNL